MRFTDFMMPKMSGIKNPHSLIQSGWGILSLPLSGNALTYADRVL